MKMKNVDRKFLIEVSDYLFKLCHVYRCKKFRDCPANCECRFERKTKLNIKTALLWDIGDLVYKCAWAQNTNEYKRAKKQLESLYENFNTMFTYHFTYKQKTLIYFILSILRAANSENAAYVKTKYDFYKNEFKDITKRITRKGLEK